MSRVLLLLAALALALPLAAAEEPEAVYAKYHRAVARGNVEEMMRYTTDEHRAEMSALSPRQRVDSVKMIDSIMPATYKVLAKTVYPESSIARLYVSGAAKSALQGKPGTLYGVVRLIVQHGEWKVDNVQWSNVDPGVTSPAREQKGAAK
ncbi:MAG TPA: hypothetical protein VMT02_04500 [Burkholderiales bacterium]|jgi:hypothetical protein|nr:hypothetical protein [Burkholderiales bacterium]